MAQFKEFKFKLTTETDDKQLEVTIKSLEDYEKELKKLNDMKVKPGLDPKELDKINQEISELEKNFKDAGNEVGKTTTKMDATTANLKTLKKELRGVKAGTKEFKDLTQQIEDMEDELKSAGRTSSSFSEQLESAPGIVGQIARGFETASGNVKSFGAAVKATGVGLLVALIGTLVAAFASNESAMKKLQPLFDGLQKILGGIFRAFEPVLDVFVEMAMKALPHFTNAIGAVYSSLYGFFTFIKEFGMGVGKILKGIFTGDVTEGFEQLKGSVRKSVDSGLESFKRFQAGSKELTESEKEELEKRRQAQKEAADKAEQLRQENLKKQKEGVDAAIQLEKNKADTDEKILRELLEKKDTLENDQILKEKERLEKKKNLTKAEKERLEDIKNLLLLQQQARDTAVKDELQKDKDTEKQKKEEREKTYKELLDRLKKYLDDENKTIEEKRNQNNKKDQQALKQRLLDGLITEEQYGRQSLEQNLKFAEQKQTDDKAAFEKQKGALILSLVGRQIDYETFNTALTDLNNQFDNIRINNEIAVKDANQAIGQDDLNNKKKYAEQYVTVKQQETETIIAQQMAQADAFAFLGGVLQAFAGNSKEVAIAGLLIEQGANVAKILTQSSASIAGATAQANLVPIILPPAIPNPAYPIAQANLARSIATTKLQAAIGIGTVIASTIQGIGQINQAFKQKSEQEKKQRGGILMGPLHAQGGIMTPYGELEGGEYVINRASTMMFRPQLDRINALGGGQVDLTQSVLSGNVNQSSEPPIIKTYVVAQDMSSQQELDRVIRDRSKI